MLQLYSKRAWKTSARMLTLSCCMKLTRLQLCETSSTTKPSSGEDCHTVTLFSIDHLAIVQHCRKQCRRSLSQFLCRPRRIPQLWQQWFLQSSLLIFSTCCFRMYSRGLNTTTDVLKPLQGCNFFILTFGINWYMTLLPNPIRSTAKTSSSKQTILRMHSVCSSFDDLWIKCSRDEVGQRKIPCSHLPRRPP